MVLTKIVKDSGGHLSVHFTLTFRLIIKIMELSRYQMEALIFDTGFEKSRNFYVRNHIFKFVIVTLRGYNQGKIVKKYSEAVY